MKTKTSSERIREPLAADGGVPVRSTPLPEESPGIHYFGDKELEYVSRVIKSHSPFRFYGPDLQQMCDRLEERFRDLYGVKYALGVSSGTEALYISMAALGVGPGDEVLVPDPTWMTHTNMVKLLGGVPVRVACDPGCLLNIGGYLHRHHPDKEAVHIASFLAQAIQDGKQ